MAKLLLLEDDIALNHGIALSLKGNDCEIVQCFTVREAKEQLKKQSFDLILLDINLPDGNGFDFCKEIRQTSRTPIIFLTANDLEIDIVTGLELGGDDYITKPFSLMVLRARVSALLRRMSEDTLAHVVKIDQYKFDFEHLEFFNGDEKVQLSLTEQKLLKVLIQHKGLTLPRATLVDKIWSNEGDFVDENALSVTINRLRKKLNANSYIKTVYGIGYTWSIEHD